MCNVRVCEIESEFGRLKIKYIREDDEREISNLLLYGNSREIWNKVCAECS